MKKGNTTMKNLRNTLKLVLSSRKSKVAVGAIAAGVVLTSVTAFAGWSPNRSVFDWNNTDQRKGSLNGPVWNSFVNTPYYGDERAFFDAANTDQASDDDAFKDVLSNVTQGSKEVILRTYIHNNANQDTNASGVGVAENAKVRIDLPTDTSTMLRARSYISSSNAAPGYPTEVTDTTELVDTSAFALDYVEGSARIYNAAHNEASGGVQLSDSIVGSGATIGYDTMNGSFPGCFEYQAMVEIRVKIVTPEVDFSKQVRKAGTTAYGETATVKPGEKVQWMISFKNDGDTKIDDVNVSDQLPPHVALVPGSVRYIYKGTDGQDHDDVQNDTQLFTTGGLATGDWSPGGGYFVRFDTTAKDDFETCEVTVRNVAYYKSKQHPAEKEDHADVKIVKENCKIDQPVEPTYKCEVLTKEYVNGRTYRLRATAARSGDASVKHYTYNFGDNTPELVTDKDVVEHTYPENGDFVSRVKVTFTVKGTEKVVESESCKVLISTKTTPPTTTTPTALPSTGAGSVASLFGLTTVFGAIGHRVWTVRRFNRG